jgi:hypothetical protein
MDGKFISQHYLIIILVVGNILFAIFLGSDFGESWDEQLRYDIALEAIEKYSNLEPANRIGGKGPIYYVSAKIGGDLIRLINPGLTHIQAWHYIHFLTFIFGIIAFYIISLRYLNPTYAFATTALFNTQPLLFGHAFINPKDVPLMSSFLVIFASGLIMVEQFNTELSESSLSMQRRLLKNAFLDNWSELNIFQMLGFVLFGVITFSTFFVLLFLANQVHRIIQSAINHITNPLIFKLLDNIASSAFDGSISGGITLQNVEKAYPLFMIILGIIITIGWILFVACLFPKVFLILTGYSSRKQLFSDLLSVMRNGYIYPAAIILGLSINNRSLSITAGLFVLFYLWIKKKSFFIPTILVYFGIAFLTLYITWPGLWGNPLTGLIKSMLSDTTFSWEGKILFMGKITSSKELPDYYIPFLMLIQFTIPALILCVGGIIGFLFDSHKETVDKTLFAIFLAWFALPLVAVAVVEPTIYDNFRHFLFITPPIFFFAGWGIQYFLSRIPNQVISVLVILIILTPGILSIIQLHPYQYIYYNKFVGGVEGAFRNFETDYWVTSYQECIEYINQRAENNSLILVFGPPHLVRNNLRNDLKLFELTMGKYGTGKDRKMIQESDYAIISSRYNNDIELFPDSETLFRVEESGAILAVVKDLRE